MKVLYLMWLHRTYLPALKEDPSALHVNKVLLKYSVLYLYLVENLMVTSDKVLPALILLEKFLEFVCPYYIKAS